MASKPEPKQPKLCAFQKFEAVTIPRSEIHNAPYNPRTITEKAEARLRANLRKVGLLEPIVWNRTTGNIVSGHRRLAILDALSRTEKYTLTVAAVNLDKKTEREQNIFMNNPNAQGDWDMEKLSVLVRDPEKGVDMDAAGFDLGDIHQLFGDLAARPAEHLIELANRVREVADRQKASKEKISKRDQTHFYLVAVFESDEARVAFTSALKLPDNRYVDGRQLLGLLKGLARGR